MAKRKEENSADYSLEVKKLKAGGPQRLYLIRGEEGYLREQFLLELKKLCIPDGEDSFSYRRFDGPELDYKELATAIDAVPFMSEYSLVELRGININKLKDTDKLISVLSDIPEYCVVAFLHNDDPLDQKTRLDGRLKIVKELREKSTEIVFNAQPQGKLVNWIGRRFAAAGKSVDLEAVQRLTFISGTLMNRLIPEIDKVAAFTKGNRVTVEDVEAVAQHIPSAEVFEMTEQMANRNFERAADTLAELLSNDDNDPTFMNALLGSQMRRLYAARLALEKGWSVKQISKLCNLKYDFIAEKLMKSARRFSLSELKRAVELCADTDYKMKSSSTDDAELLKQCVMLIAAGEADA